MFMSVRYRWEEHHVAQREIQYSDPNTMTGQWQRRLAHATARRRVAIALEVVGWLVMFSLAWLYRDETARTTPVWVILVMAALALAVVFALPTISILGSRIRNTRELLAQYGAPVTRE
ncbi:hypothetical protein HYV74_02280 [Candidatus Uhrbacteria bacterium]|nr:hypothetical protein [Candidatus Uhrbacteria bacterium]